ncbi:terminase large subunit [Brevibacillus choshinensis]|uniref:terminase large subunit n=1 Tax=Brevibacillus choshinensis TaxID=54911 RepID=UPI002E219FAC|nr:terminase TerL endonuclease subunit [Brevibacillus choshinensis]MED4586663.1 terminase large subunit [Brevibacillus choshinensis]
MDAVTQYANDVLNGIEVAGGYVRKACERHLRDLERQGTDEFPYVFDEKLAEKVHRFFRFCSHTKGELAGQPIALDPFQKFILGSVFGWIHKDTGLRRYRKAYVQLARKNAKSTILSGVGLYMLMADKEGGAEVYCTATKREQARIVYEDAKAMGEKSKDLSKRLKTTRDAIFHKTSGSKMLPLSKDTKTLDGLNPHLGIIDEYHAHPTSEMYDVVVSGMGQRPQPLLFIITTAGFNLSAPCFTEYEYCCKLMDGTLDNESYFVFIAQMDKEDDVGDETAWIKANPLMAKDEKGMQYLREEWKIAQDVPEKMRNFLTKNLNIWVDMKENGYMPMDKWKDCGVAILPELSGRECYAGIDLSKKIDLTSISFEFPLDDGKVAVLSHSFIPEDTLVAKRQTDKVPYDLWEKQGWLTVTPGAVVDYQFIKAYMLNLIEENNWKIKETCYDPYNATQFAQDMEAEGFLMVEIRQGVKTLSEPTKNFREMVLSGNVIHDNNPVLTWAVSNAVTKQDHNENIMLDKDKSTNRIDPIAALINAHVRCMLSGFEPDLNKHIMSDDFSF